MYNFVSKQEDYHIIYKCVVTVKKVVVTNIEFYNQ